jgi:hypothetical protein
VKIPKDMVFPSEGITNAAYLKQMRLQEARAERDPILDKAVELLDAYVAAYDRRQAYGGSRIAGDDTVDRTYNGMLRREEERAQAFFARVVNDPDAARPGLGLHRTPHRVLRGWLAQVSQAQPGKDRAVRRAEVVRELKRPTGGQ